MDIHEKLMICERYMKEQGYGDASIMNRNTDSEMLVFQVPNVSAKYPGEKPNISITISDGGTGREKADFDIMQVLCFISNGVPDDRLRGIGKFCSDFNKSLQIGDFGVDYKNESVYYKCTQILMRDIVPSDLRTMLNNMFGMIFFYFGYSYEIILELSYGIIGYENAPERLDKRKHAMMEAMEELRDTYSRKRFGRKNRDREELLNEMIEQLKQDEQESKRASSTDFSSSLKAAKKREDERAASEDVKQKMADISGLDGGVRIDTAGRKTVSAGESQHNARNSMPSVEMYTKKVSDDRNIDLEEIRRALRIEQEEREKKLREAESAADADDLQQNDGADDEGQESSPGTVRKRAGSEMSLVQRLRSWTQNR